MKSHYKVGDKIYCNPRFEDHTWYHTKNMTVTRIVAEDSGYTSLQVNHIFHNKKESFGSIIDSDFVIKITRKKKIKRLLKYINNEIKEY